MANKALALYTGSNSTFNLEIPQPANPTPKNTYVREEVRAVTMAPLAIMPNLGGHPCQGQLRGANSLKRKTPKSATKSVRVTPLGNTVYSCSYTIVGVQKPNGGCGKGLMRKPGRGKGPATPV
jgi:hypothetical protein